MAHRSSIIVHPRHDSHPPEVQALLVYSSDSGPLVIRLDAKQVKELRDALDDCVQLRATSVVKLSP